MFEKIKKSGLSVDEYARIVGVSRVAVFNWKAGRTTVHPQVQPKIEKATTFLTRLLELKKLPLKEGLSREERKEKVLKLKGAFDSYSK